MSLKSTFVLMVLFILLGSFAIFDPFSIKEKKEAEKDRADHVFWLKDKKAESLSIKNRDLFVRLSCELPEGCSFDSAGKWNILEPVKDKADYPIINSVMSSILNLSPVDKMDFPQAPDLKEFGFDRSDLEFSFKLKGESNPVSLKFGSISPVASNIYALVSTEPNRVYILPDPFAVLFRKDLFQWRNKKLFPDFLAEKVGQISWSSENAKISAVKKDGFWFLNKPIEARASFPMLEGIANTIEVLVAKALFANSSDTVAAKKVLQKKPILEVDFGLPGKMESLKIYKTPNNDAAYYVAKVQGRDALYLIERSPVARFEKDLKEYRNRRLMNYEDTNKADEVVFEFPRDNKKITLKSVNGKWEYSAGDKPEEPISQHRVEKILDQLENGEVADFVSSKEKVALYNRLVDSKIILKSAGRELVSLRFTLDSKNSAITAGDLPNEVKVLNGDLLAALPIRLNNLYESANKKVIVEPKAGSAEEDSHHGHID